MKYRFFTLLLLLIFGCFNNYGQEQKVDSLTFAKGRYITSLYGTLSNQKVAVASGEEIRTIGYTLGTKSGRFIKDNLVLGGNFSLSKSDVSNPFVDIESEELVLGVWSRLYFSQKGSGALFAEVTPYYIGIHKQNSVYDNNNVLLTNEDITGSGFGVSPGIGFTYLVNKNVGFGMTLSYPWAKINVDTENRITASTTSSTYNVTQLQFSFNFQIYLDQFFF